MKFSDLKNAVSGETVLISRNKNERTFIGFIDGFAVFTANSGSTERRDRFGLWPEKDLENWTIKKEERLYYIWDFEHNRVWIRTSCFYNDDFHNTAGDTHTHLKNAKNKRKVLGEENLLRL